MTNVQHLIAIKMSVDAVPSGGRINDALSFLLDKDQICASGEGAIAWAKSAIQAVRNVQEPNPWKESDDESIAGEILRRIQEKDTKRIIVK